MTRLPRIEQIPQSPDHRGAAGNALLFTHTLNRFDRMPQFLRDGKG